MISYDNNTNVSFFILLLAGNNFTYANFVMAPDSTLHDQQTESWNEIFNDVSPVSGCQSSCYSHYLT